MKKANTSDRKAAGNPLTYTPILRPNDVESRSAAEERF
jgi:hypothetical protein